MSTYAAGVATMPAPRPAAPVQPMGVGGAVGVGAIVLGAFWLGDLVARAARRGRASSPRFFDQFGRPIR